MGPTLWCVGTYRRDGHCPSDSCRLTFVVSRQHSCCETLRRDQQNRECNGDRSQVVEELAEEASNVGHDAWFVSEPSVEVLTNAPHFEDVVLSDEIALRGSFLSVSIGWLTSMMRRLA